MVEIITKLFNMSISQGKFPDALKMLRSYPYTKTTQDQICLTIDQSHSYLPHGLLKIQPYMLYKRQENKKPVRPGGV